MADELSRKISALSTEELVRMVTFNLKDYREEALVMAINELRERGYNESDFGEIGRDGDDSILPLSIDDVPCVTDSTRGDIIVTKGVLYYFPFTTKPLRSNLLGEAGDGMGLRSTNRSLLRKKGLWKDDDSDESLRERLDAHISRLKEADAEGTHGQSFFRRLLATQDRALPERVSSDSVERIFLSGDGEFAVVSSDSSVETLQFNVGMLRKQMLEDALWQAGFPRLDEV